MLEIRENFGTQWAGHAARYPDREPGGPGKMTCTNCPCPFNECLGEAARSAKTEIRCLLADAVRHVSFDRGEVLFQQGQESSNLFTLSSGIVKISCYGTDGREQIVGLSAPGNLLIGLQSLHATRYAYSATAATDVRACAINHRVVLERVRSHGELALRLVDAVNTKLAQSRALIRVLGHKYAAAKIASFILLMTPEHGYDHKQYRLPFSRLELASLLGLSQETVCRQMANLKRLGVIRAPRGSIEITDRHRLRALAEGDNQT